MMMIIFTERQTWFCIRQSHTLDKVTIFPFCCVWNDVALLKIWYDFISEIYIDSVVQQKANANAALHDIQFVHNSNRVSFVFIFGVPTKWQINLIRMRTESRRTRRRRRSRKKVVENISIAPSIETNRKGSGFLFKRNCCKMKWNSFISIKYRYSKSVQLKCSPGLIFTFSSRFFFLFHFLFVCYVLVFSAAYVSISDDEFGMRNIKMTWNYYTHRQV